MNRQLLEDNYKISNYQRILDYINTEFPNLGLDKLCRLFGYKQHVRDLICGLSDENYAKTYPEVYAKIQKAYGNARSGVLRNPFETARDIFANFIMEDLFLYMIKQYFPYLKDRIRVNDEEDRDIVNKKPSNLPDFVFTTKEGKTVNIELKRVMSSYQSRNNTFDFKFREFEDYHKYNAIVFIWMPNDKKATLVDFRDVSNMKVKDTIAFGDRPAKTIDLANCETFNFNIKDMNDVEVMLRKLHALIMK